MEKDCSTDMRSIMDTITTATITAHSFQPKLMHTAVGVAVILKDLTRTKKIESSRKPEHIKYCKDGVRYDGKDYECPNFSNDFGSNIRLDTILP
jgi:hypothetical protein